MKGGKTMYRTEILDPTKKGREAEELETRLRQLVIGQDEAITQIGEAYQAFVTGMSPPGRPVGNFLFLGPTQARLSVTGTPTEPWRVINV
jgi:ATP-dependent Clp protease ATP-binding subunit ClpA